MTIRQLVGNSVYIDVDANIGAIALPVAQAGTRVIADVIRWLLKFRPRHACAERIASGQGVPVLAVLLTSHHQTAGKGAAPYLGNGSGRPKRSQRAARTLS